MGVITGNRRLIKHFEVLIESLVAICALIIAGIRFFDVIMLPESLFSISPIKTAESD